MKKLRKYAVLLSVCMCFILANVMSAAAAREDEDSDEINGCTLSVTSSIEAGSDLGTVTVTSDSSRYHVESYDFVGTGSSWKPGDVPKVKVIVEADSGYYFSSKIGTSRITVKGATCSGVKRLNSGNSIEITLRLKAVRGEMGDIEEAFWVSSPIGRAKWDEAANATAYELKLYRGDTCIKTVDKTTTTSYDFYSYMTKVGSYYFKVRPVPRSSNEAEYLDAGNWTSSDELYIDRTTVAQEGATGNVPPDSAGGRPGDPDHVPFGWVQNGSGWWYHNADGSYPTNGWAAIDNKWYFFDMAGYMKTGWIIWNQHYYYLSVNGDMQTGWLEDNKKWYYLGQDGAMQTGWVNLGGIWYYLNADGARASGWQALNGKWYYFDPVTGGMAVNTVIGGRYVNGDGVWIP